MFYYHSLWASFIGTSPPGEKVTADQETRETKNVAVERRSTYKVGDYICEDIKISEG